MLQLSKSGELSISSLSPDSDDEREHLMGCASSSSPVVRRFRVLSEASNHVFMLSASNRADLVKQIQQKLVAM